MYRNQLFSYNIFIYTVTDWYNYSIFLPTRLSLHTIYVRTYV